METELIRKEKSYIEINDIARSPTLQTVLMVERFIEDNSGKYKKTELFKKLPKKVMWQTYQVIMEHLEEIKKIIPNNEGFLEYIWDKNLLKMNENSLDIKA